MAKTSTEIQRDYNRRNNYKHTKEYHKRTGHKHTYAYQAKQKTKWIELFKELGYDTCQKCGYNKCFAAIDFHHRDSAQKKFSIAVVRNWSFSDSNITKVLEEITKCDILCANCHRELHWST